MREYYRTIFYQSSRHPSR